MQSTIYGLDFGTTNSVIAVLEPRAGGRPQAHVLPIGHDGAMAIPSILFFPNGGGDYRVGDDALRDYLASQMNGRLMQSLKMFLPDADFRGTTVPTLGRCSLERLIALMMTEIKRRADALVGEDVRRVVLGRPGRFSADEEEELTAERRLIAAARLAGFEDIRFQREPVAAAFFYETKLAAPETALVADLGGGTSDFTIVRLAPPSAGTTRRGDRASDILGTRSVSFAGDDFDSALMYHKLTPWFGAHTRYQASPGQWLELPAHLMHTICRWRTIPFLRERRTREFIEQLLASAEDQAAIRRLQCLVEENIGFSLFKSIEQVKIELSGARAGEIVFTHDMGQEPFAIREPVTRAEFNTMMRPGLARLRGCIERLLEDCALAPAQIDAVFMTGGTSRVVSVQRLLAKMFGAEKLRPGDAFISVASGLALSAPGLFGGDAPRG